MEVECCGCPECGAKKTRVLESRPVVTGVLSSSRRRRRCLRCGHTYATIEVPEVVAKEVFTDEHDQ